MSIKAMAWVMDEAPVENTTEMVVLYVLADAARDDGTCAWPSHATIARKTRCSRRTVIRHINELERRGLIYRGDQRHVSHIPADKRPVVWNINMAMTIEDTAETGCQNVTPDGSGVTSTVERGDNGGTSGVTSTVERGDNGVTQPVLNPSLNPSITQSPSADGPETADPFDEFWDAYPRKIGDKKRTQAKFTELATETGTDILIAAARNYAAECEHQNRAKIYIPYPSTFLNQGRWKDYSSSPSTTPNGAKPTREEITTWDITELLKDHEKESTSGLPF